jgi:FR47-like protein.
MNNTEIPADILQDYESNVNIIEPVSQGLLKIVLNDPDCYLVKIKNIYVCYLRNDDGADKVLRALTSAKDILCVNGYDSPLMKQSRRWISDYHDYNFVYESREKIAYELQEGASIRSLNIKDLDYVFNHYKIVQDRVYLKDRIHHGMYGVVVERKLRGFVGTHTEGSVGILFVEELSQRMHFGSALEAEMINHLLEKEIVPFTQVEVHNVASKRLQESLGLVKGEKPVHWYF